jgi:hypothetical protein
MIFASFLVTYQCQLAWVYRELLTILDPAALRFRRLIRCNFLRVKSQFSAVPTYFYRQFAADFLPRGDNRYTRSDNRHKCGGRYISGILFGPDAALYLCQAKKLRYQAMIRASAYATGSNAHGTGKRRSFSGKKWNWCRKKLGSAAKRPGR